MADYVLKYSHNIIEHLGFKLYQNKPTNAIAELISNSWDAYATEVCVDLITNKAKPIAICVADNGYGMTKAEIIENWLVIAKPKSVSRKATAENHRPPMGRKGIGKLAPFGIANNIDLITIKDNKITWLRLDYSLIASIESNQLIKEYKPEVIIDSEDVGNLSNYENMISFFKNEEMYNILKKRLDFLIQKQQGTLIYCHNLSIKRIINEKHLKESLGKRFTVSLRPDFSIKINELKLEEKDCFPEWSLRIPEQGYETITVPITFTDANGNTKTEDKKVNAWIGFISTTLWAQDESGIGIYAHGKIAQDRPYTFQLKGREIFTRYCYGVIEADWIDEFDEDIISTDRTSINWEHEGMESFREWGEAYLKQRIKQYEDFKTQSEVDNNTLLVDSLLEKKPFYNIRSSEKRHLVDLVSEVTTKIESNEQKELFIEATTKAWIHEPARKLIKNLWDKSKEIHPEHFAELLYKLSDELVPESLSLAVIFSQRVYALTQLYQRISLKKETDLQKLLEEFPWILGQDYDQYYANQTLKTIVKDAIEEGTLIPARYYGIEDEDRTRPDFVFLESPNRQILVVELKGPEVTVQAKEIQQIQSYIWYLQERFSQSNITGMIVSGYFDERFKTMEGISKITWDDILTKSRKEHTHLLIGLLAGSDVQSNDHRVQQIRSLGGPVIEEFLQKIEKNHPDYKMIKS